MSRLVTLVSVVALLVVSCSAASELPSELDGMTTGQVGCTSVVGEDEPAVLGPLGANEQQVYQPWDGFSIRVEQRNVGVAVTVTEYSEAKGDDIVSSATKGWDDLPTDGEGTEVIRADADDHITGVATGYVVSCWRGES